VPRIIEAKQCPHCGAGLPQPVPRSCPACAGSLQQRYLKAGCFSTAPPCIAGLIGLWQLWVSLLG
jgi:hypothetical protein